MSNKDKKFEKEEIDKIIGKIDTIMHGEMLKHKNQYLNSTRIISDTIGATSFGIVGITLLSSNNANSISEFTSRYLVPIILGAFICCSGAFTSAILSTLKNRLNEDEFLFYEKAYLQLSRQEQLDVLNLVKKLVSLLEREIKFNNNKKYLSNFLQFNDNKTMFDSFEINHPHFEILSSEQIDEIHSKGMLTPNEKYIEWVKSGVCIPDSCIRCEKYNGDCRDCLVDLANEEASWPPMKFENECILDIKGPEKKITKKIINNI